ncbi:MAG: hypothetical protein J2P59_11335, partial [Acidimicrobiales bacterium]|nr:hypothetical protein [Acidimicrobiales bacterium]
EDPLAIIDEVKSGARPGSELVVEADRAAAIARSVGAARPGDVVVVAGKGHERHQEMATRSIEFDDRQVAREAIKRLLGSSA